MAHRSALFEAFETDSAFRLWHTENNVCQCLSCRGEGYSWSGSLTILTDGETNNEEQLWVITSFTEDGNAFKIANVKHGLFLCAHRRLAGPILFCHRENGESDQAWLCLPTRQDRFDLNNVSVGKVANGSWHVEHVRAFAGFSRRPAPTTPAAGSDTMGIAAAAGAAGAVLGAAAVVVGASLLATDNDENRTRNANDRRRDVQRRREQDDNTALAAAAAGAALGAVAGFSNAISYFSGTAPMSSASTPVGSSTGTAPQPTPASSGTATSPHSTPASVSTGTATQSPVRVVEERYSAAARASQTPSDGGSAAAFMLDLFLVSVSLVVTVRAVLGLARLF